MVELPGKPARKLKLVDGAGQAFCRSGSSSRNATASGSSPSPRQAPAQRGHRKARARGVHGSDIFLGARDLLHRGASGIGVVPKARGDAFGLELRYAGALLVQMEVRLNSPTGPQTRPARRALPLKPQPLTIPPWQYLNFLPLPQGHGSLRPTLTYGSSLSDLR